MISFRLCWVSVDACGLSLSFRLCRVSVDACGLSLGAVTRGFSCHHAWALGVRASAVAFEGLVVPWHVGSSRARGWTGAPCTARRLLGHWTSSDAPEVHYCLWLVSCSSEVEWKGSLSCTELLLHFRQESAGCAHIALSRVLCCSLHLRACPPPTPHTADLCHHPVRLKAEQCLLLLFFFRIVLAEFLCLFTYILVYFFSISTKKIAGVFAGVALICIAI